MVQAACSGCEFSITGSLSGEVAQKPLSDVTQVWLSLPWGRGMD